MICLCTYLKVDSTAHYLAHFFRFMNMTVRNTRKKLTLRMKLLESFVLFLHRLNGFFQFADG